MSDRLIEYGALGRLTLCRIEASSQCGIQPPDDVRLECHEAVKVVFQERGSALYRQGGASVAIGPGEGLVYDVSRAQRVIDDGVTSHVVVIVPKEIARMRGLAGDGPPLRRFSATGGAGRLARDMVHATLREMPAIGAGCEAGLADSLLGLIALPLAADRERLSPAERVRHEVKAHIEAHLRDPDLSLDAIARSLGCSKRYLHMCFAAEGMSIGDYLRQARLERCRRELERAAETGRTVTEIAYDHGFNSSSHFSRLYKGRFGHSPSRARN